MLRAGHPLLIIEMKDRERSITALKQIRSEGTDEHLISFFISVATARMQAELDQKRRNTNIGLFLF